MTWRSASVNSRWLSKAPYDDRGSVTLLGLGIAMICLALVALGVDATALQLRRTELWNLADGAALAAADAMDEPAYFVDGVAGPKDLPRLRTDLVTDRVRDYLSRATPATARLARARAIGENTAEVTLTTRVRPPLSGPFLAAWGSGITLTVTSRARAG